MARRSVAQRRATRKLVARNKSRRRKKRSSSRRRPKRIVAKRRGSRRRSVSGGFCRAKSGIGNIFKSGIPGKVVQGLGAAALATIVLDRIAPQFSPAGNVAAGFLGGGLIGGAANLLVSGGLGNLGGILGGGSVNGGGESI